MSNNILKNLHFQNKKLIKSFKNLVKKINDQTLKMNKVFRENNNIKFIEGTEKRYKITDFGLIYDLKKDKMLSNRLNAGKYETANIAINGVKRRWLVHRLVMETYVGKSNLEVNHKDGVRTNNNLSNLEYCTRQQNFLHAQHTLGVGPNPYGKSNKRKLTDVQILTIFTMTNKTHTEMAEHYDILGGKISEIRKGYSYREYYKIIGDLEYPEGRGKHLRNANNYIKYGI